MLRQSSSHCQSNLLGLLWSVRTQCEPISSLADAIIHLSSKSLPTLKLNGRRLTSADIMRTPLSLRTESVAAWESFICNCAHYGTNYYGHSQSKLAATATALLATRILAEHIWLFSKSEWHGDNAHSSIDQNVDDDHTLILDKDVTSARLEVDGDGVDENFILNQPEALLIQPIRDLSSMLETVGMDISALALEKHGVVPPLNIDDSLQHLSPAIASVPMYLDKIFRELLKNAFASTISRYGVDADISPGVQLKLSKVRNETVVSIIDCGIRLQDERAIFNWFYTSQIPDNSPSYTFSGTFGGVLAGEGIGLSLSRAYTEILGGRLQLSSVYRRSGAELVLTLPHAPT